MNRRSQTNRGGKAKRITSNTSSFSQPVKSRDVSKARHKVQNPEVNPDDWMIPDKSTGDFLSEDNPVVKLRYFLNEITMNPGEFERKIQLLTNILNTMVDDDETMRTIVNIIFEESVRQPNLRYSAARLCKALCNDLDVSPDRLNFRSVLLTRCGQEFKRRDILAQAEDGGKYLRGFAMFFAELFSQLEVQKQKISVLVDSLPNLIKTILYYDSPDNLKCACQILKLVGADLEAYERNMAINNETGPNMDFIMVTLKKFATSSGYENRIKEMIKGVINLRDSSWGRSLHTENSEFETSPPTAVPDEVESIHLGPGWIGLSSWGRGSSGGAKAPEGVKTALTNRYGTRGCMNEPQESTKRLNDELVESAELVFDGPEVDKEDMEIKTKTILDDFFRSKDFDKAIKSVQELISPNTAHLFIDSALYQVFGKSRQSKNMLGQLLCSLAQKNVITFDHYKKGFENILKLQKEYFSEIMKVNKHLGEILAPLVDKDDSSSLQSLKDVLKPCMGNSEEEEYNGFLASCILQCAGIPKKLDFTLCPTDLKLTPMTCEEMKKNLSSLLRKSEKNEEIFDWIDANVQDLENDFIRALVTAVHEDVITVTDQSCKLNASRLKKRSPLLTRYISGNEKLEMQALYAIQYLMKKLGHPTGLMHQIFKILYDDDVITVYAFKKWERNDLDETEGKVEAVHSTTSFLLGLENLNPVAKKMLCHDNYKP